MMVAEAPGSTETLFIQYISELPQNNCSHWDLLFLKKKKNVVEVVFVLLRT